MIYDYLFLDLKFPNWKFLSVLWNSVNCGLKYQHKSKAAPFASYVNGFESDR